MGFPRKLNINPKTLVTVSHTIEDIFKLSPGERKEYFSADPYVFRAGEFEEYFKSAKNEKTGHECKYEFNYQNLPTESGGTEIYILINVELKFKKWYLTVAYEPKNTTDDEIRSITEHAESTFIAWCAAIGATPPETPPSPPAKKEILAPAKPQNPMDDEIQF